MTAIGGGGGGRRAGRGEELATETVIWRPSRNGDVLCHFSSRYSNGCPVRLRRRARAALTPFVAEFFLKLLSLCWRAGASPGETVQPDGFHRATPFKKEDFRGIFIILFYCVLLYCLRKVAPGE